MTRPDRFIVVKIINNELEEPIYKVFATWLGGYLDGDSWKMNSGIIGVEKEGYSYNVSLIVDGEIEKVERQGVLFNFHGDSGSIYRCHEGAYGTSGYSQGILDGITKKAEELGHTIEVMPEDTDWTKLI